MGYENIVKIGEVKKVNGEEIVNLRHLIRIIETTEKKFTRFDLDRKRFVLLYSDCCCAGGAYILSLPS